MKMRAGVVRQSLDDCSRWLDYLSLPETEDTQIRHWLANLGYGCLEILVQIAPRGLIADIKKRIAVTDIPPGAAWPMILACERVHWLLQLTREQVAVLPSSQLVDVTILPLNTPSKSSEVAVADLEELLAEDATLVFINE
jgi:hypothetical protein